MKPTYFSLFLAVVSANPLDQNEGNARVTALGDQSPEGVARASKILSSKIKRDTADLKLKVTIFGDVDYTPGLAQLNQFIGLFTGFLRKRDESSQTNKELETKLNSLTAMLEGLATKVNQEGGGLKEFILRLLDFIPFVGRAKKRDLLTNAEAGVDLGSLVKDLLDNLADSDGASEHEKRDESTNVEAGLDLGSLVNGLLENLAGSDSERRHEKRDESTSVEAGQDMGSLVNGLDKNLADSDSASEHEKRDESTNMEAGLLGSLVNGLVGNLAGSDSASKHEKRDESSNLEADLDLGSLVNGLVGNLAGSDGANLLSGLVGNLAGNDRASEHEKRDESANLDIVQAVLKNFISKDELEGYLANPDKLFSRIVGNPGFMKYIEKAAGLFTKAGNQKREESQSMETMMDAVLSLVHGNMM